VKFKAKKMKSVLVLLVACLVAVSGRYMTNEVKYADNDFMVKQKAIFEIFMNVWQKEIHNDYYEQSQKFSFEGFKEHVGNAEVYERFMHFYDYGFLSMDEIYAPFQSEQNEQMLSIFKIFYFVKGWDNFYNFMVWARYHINPGMFIQALTVRSFKKSF
jgi:hypothetical protein